MNATTVAVDLAKNVFQLAVADASWRMIETHRLLADPGSVIPELIRGSMKLLIEEIRLLEQRSAQLEKELTALAA